MTGGRRRRRRRPSIVATTSRNRHSHRDVYFVFVRPVRSTREIGCEIAAAKVKIDGRGGKHLVLSGI